MVSHLDSSTENVQKVGNSLYPAKFITSSGRGHRLFHYESLQVENNRPELLTQKVL